MDIASILKSIDYFLKRNNCNDRLPVPWGTASKRGNQLFEWKQKDRGKTAYWRLQISHRPAKVKTVYFMTQHKGKIIINPSIIISFNFYINIDKIDARALGLTFTNGKHKRVYYVGSTAVAEITSVLNRVRLKKICNESMNLVDTILGKSIFITRDDVKKPIAQPESNQNDRKLIPTLDERGNFDVTTRMELIQRWLLVQRIRRARLLEMTNIQIIEFIKNNLS